MAEWLTEWLKYLFAPRARYAPSWLTVIWCRWHGHPAGVIWFNPYGLEPDMHCKCCGDDLG